jgi:hypothetical protein
VTFDSVIPSSWLRDAVRTSAVGPLMDGFVAAAARVGYTEESLYGLVDGATRFVRYLTGAGVHDVAQVRDQHVEAFLSTLPTYLCCNGYRMRHVAGTRGAHALMRYLRAIGVTPPEPPPGRSYSWVLRVDHISSSPPRARSRERPDVSRQGPAVSGRSRRRRGA